ncbi:hypothetical protein K6025_05315 [Ehrlichia sp. JZT12]
MFSNFVKTSIKAHVDRLFIFVHNFFNKTCTTRNDEICSKLHVQTGVSFDHDSMLGEVCRIIYSNTYCYKDTIYSENTGESIIYWMKYLAHKLESCIFRTSNLIVDQVNPAIPTSKSCSDNFNHAAFMRGLAIAYALLMGLCTINLLKTKLRSHSISKVRKSTVIRDNIYSEVPYKNIPKTDSMTTIFKDTKKKTNLLI